MAYDDHDSGTVHWDRNTTTTHHVTFTMADSMLAPISEGDTLKIVLHGRSRTVVMTVTPHQLRRLMEQPEDLTY